MSLEDFKNGDGFILDTDAILTQDVEIDIDISKTKTNNQIALSFIVGSRTGTNNGTLGDGGTISFYGKIGDYWHNIELDLDFEADFPTKTIKNSRISTYRARIKKGANADFIITVSPTQKISDS